MQRCCRSLLYTTPTLHRRWLPRDVALCCNARHCCNTLHRETAPITPQVMAAKQEVKLAANAKQLPPAPPPPNAALVGRALPPGGVAGGVPIEVRAGSCMMHGVLLHDFRDET